MAKESASSGGGWEHNHEHAALMTHKYMGSILAFSISKSVEPGHENLPPILLVDDEETPRRLGDCCNGWVLLWPKSLLHLEAAGSTPTSTQLGMNINTSPNQLVSAVVLGDSGGVRKRLH